MVRATHKPPARVRYEQSHPSVSFRVDRDTYTLFKQRLDDLGVSAADFIKESLGLLQPKMPDIGRIKRLARDKGYREAKEEYQIWYYCNVCRKRIDIYPNSESHKAIIGYMKKDGWRHEGCVK